MTASRKPLFIVSFHRSGSSLTANLFHAAGLHLGEKLLGAKPSNPYGHFEDTEVISINDQILAATGHAWHRSRGALSLTNELMSERIKRLMLRRLLKHPSFGMKDPRFCLTLRHWRAALGEINVLFVYRESTYCVSSLWNRALRDWRAGQAVGLNHALINDPDHIARMYAHNIGSFMSWYASVPDKQNRFIFADYDAIVSGAHDVVGHCRRKWGYDLGEIDVADFFDPNAVTATSDWGIRIRNDALRDHVSDLDHQIEEICNDHVPA